MENEQRPPTPSMPAWLAWTERLRAIAETGRAYSVDPFGQERYAELHEIARAMQAALLEQPPASLAGRFDLDGGYPTPKVEVRSGVLEAGRILLVREATDGRWALPGGWADQQETPAGNAVKEVQEETGLTVRAVKLVALYDHRANTYRPPRLEHVFRMLFLCERVSGELSTSLETTAVDWFPVTALPELSPGRTTPGDVERLQAHYLDPGLPTWFD